MTLEQRRENNNTQQSLGIVRASSSPPKESKSKALEKESGNNTGKNSMSKKN